jgi:DNA-binding Lrp family transcriptional regulator
MRILAALFADAPEPMSIGELAQRTGVAQSTASREVARLAANDVVLIDTVGRTSLVSANWSLPWAPELRSLLAQTVGVLGRVATALESIDGVEEAFIYGSWAARYSGDPGPPPHDIDLLIVGTASLRDVRSALRTIESDVRLDINPVILEPTRWNAYQPEPFVEQVRNRPMVALPLGRA